MKRKPQIIFGKKSMILAAVSLVLVVMTVVGVTVSWIEDVSQVEFSSTDHDQETPLRVGQKVLKADAEIKSNPNLESISLEISSMNPEICTFLPATETVKNSISLSRVRQRAEAKTSAPALRMMKTLTT